MDYNDLDEALPPDHDDAPISEMERDSSVTFNHLSDPKYHQEIYSGPSARPYTCSVCGESFIDVKDRARHEETHVKLSPGKALRTHSRSIPAGAQFPGSSSSTKNAEPEYDKSTALTWVDDLKDDGGTNMAQKELYDEFGTPIVSQSTRRRITKTTNRVLEDENLDTLERMANLALTYRDKGRWEDAEELEMKLLLDMGADPNAHGKMYDSALQAASKGGHEQLVKLLLDKGADPNAHGEEMYGSALQAASEGGHKQVVKLLLDKGADPNAHGEMYGSALLAASERGHEQVVETRVPGDKHPDTLVSMANLVSTYRDQGQERKAKELKVQVVGSDLGVDDVSKQLKAGKLPDSPFALKSQESGCVSLENMQDPNLDPKKQANRAEQMLAESISQPEQSVGALPGTQIDSELSPLLDSSMNTSPPVSRVGVLFGYCLRPAESLLEILGICEPKISPGKQRIHWTCTCGKRLYDDFVELQPGALADLREELQRMRAQGHRGSSNRGRWRIFDALRWIIDPLTRALRGHQEQTSDNLDAVQLPTHNASTSCTDQLGQASQASTPLYLLICINEGRFGVGLHEKDIRHVQCDRDLFHLLRTTYSKRQNHLRRILSFHTTSDIQFVRFAADTDRRVDIHSHAINCDRTTCICLPPVSNVEPEPNSEYRCFPVPAGRMPPLGKNYMMHNYSSPDNIGPGQMLTYNQIPKRICGELPLSLGVYSEGWGLYFQEGLDWVKICTLILILFVGGSLIFGVLYAVLEKDAQSAFGIASYWMAAATILVGCLAVRSR